MDKKEAKFILQSFRPDGADAGDPDFAEALKLAAEDRALGEWLADERALDSVFSKAFGSIAAPAGLRDSILAGETVAHASLPQADSLQDAVMIGSFASIQPPPELRGRLLAAMEQSQKIRKIQKSRVEKPGPSWWRRAALPLAAAAGIALAFLITGRGTIVVPPVASIPVRNTVPVEVVQASFIRTFESPIFSIDENRENHEQLMQILEKKKLPCPKCLPPGLVGVEGLGCRELVIDGKRGSLVCFDDPENGKVHLVIFKREDVCGDLPTRENPHISQCGPWAVARWVDENHVFVLLGSRPMEKLAGLF